MNREQIDEVVNRRIRMAVEKDAGPVNPEGRYSYTAAENDRDLTVRQVLKRRLGFSSRLLAKFKRGEGTVARNGVPVRLFSDVLPGDVLEITMPEDVSHFEPQEIPVEILYRDDDLMVVGKQPCYVVHPTRTHPSGTVANGLMKQMLESGDRYKIRFINRLDRDTSGLLVVARNSHCQDRMSAMMKAGKVLKIYEAIVHGEFEEEEGTIRLPIGRAPDDPIRRAVRSDGSPSVTHYRVLERYDGFTRLQLRLETGRTHQIRVHLSHLGHPIAGDSLYGKEEPELIGRQALHAKRLSFDHPVSGEPVDVEAPLPEDMCQLREQLVSSCRRDGIEREGRYGFCNKTITGDRSDDSGLSSVVVSAAKSGEGSAAEREALQKKMKRGLFLTFEGPDAAGKSTQIEALRQFLEEKGIHPLVLREPGGTGISEQIRSVLLDSANKDMLPVTELLLYAAARGQLVGERIRPALEQGRVVLCDRYIDSSTAYQGYGRELGNLVQEVNLPATGGLLPDRTFLLMTGNDDRRRRRSGEEADRMEAESDAFHERVREGFEQIAKHAPERVIRIDGRKPVDEIHELIRQSVSQLLEERS